MGSIHGTTRRSEVSGRAGRAGRARARRWAALLGVVSMTATLTQLAAPTAAGAAEAAGGSIVHVKDNDVWLTSPDGSSTARVTSDGSTPSPDGKGSHGYTWPTQSDDGDVIVAVRNQLEPNQLSLRGYLWVMNRRGDVLARFAPPQFEFLPEGPCGRPFLQNPRGIARAAVSPDGTKVVYEPFAQFFGTNGCFDLGDLSQVHVVHLEGSGFSGHTVIRRAENDSIGRLRDPSWVTDSRLLVESQSLDALGVNYVDLPEGLARPYYRFNATRFPTLEADKLAAIPPNFLAPTLDLFRANGGPPAAPTLRCQLTRPSGPTGTRFFLPTWAPGGGALAWVEHDGETFGDEPGEGIWASPIGDLGTTCPTRADARLVVQGGTQPFWGPAPVRSGPGTVADFDGNGRSDVSVFRPAGGLWFVQSPFSAVAWGAAGDMPVPGDYDGNGTTEHAVYRPSTGAWYLLGPDPRATAWGQPGDIPVPGDYDGNGTTDIAVFRPSNGLWFVQSPFTVIAWGQEGDIPVPGDYDGNGTAEAAVYRPSTGIWYLRSTTPTSALWGIAGDIPVPGDYDGNGSTDIAVFRPAGGLWYVRTPFSVIGGWGQPGDVPVPGDYDGNGITEPAVYRPANGTWYLRSTTPTTAVWGVAGDVPTTLPSAIYRRFFT